MKPVLVIKIGGALVDEPASMDALWQGVQALQTSHDVVVVHGGNPQVTALGRRLEHEPKFVQGRRITSDLDLDLVRWSLCGSVNTHLVAQALSCGLQPVGLTGADGSMVRVVRRPPWVVEGRSVDFGWVGDVQGIDTSLLRHLLDGAFLPIVATLGVDASGQVYNVNGDTVTGEVARALQADVLLFVTGVGHVNEGGLRIEKMNKTVEQQGVQGGWLQGGMRVKVSVGLAARAAGVPHVHIVGPSDLLQRAHGTELVD